MSRIASASPTVRGNRAGHLANDAALGKLMLAIFAIWDDRRHERADRREQQPIASQSFKVPIKRCDGRVSRLGLGKQMLLPRRHPDFAGRVEIHDRDADADNDVRPGRMNSQCHEASDNDRDVCKGIVPC